MIEVLGYLKEKTTVKLCIVLTRSYVRNTNNGHVSGLKETFETRQNPNTELNGPFKSFTSDALNPLSLFKKYTNYLDLVP